MAKKLENDNRNPEEKSDNSGRMSKDLSEMVYTSDEAVEGMNPETEEERRARITASLKRDIENNPEEFKEIIKDYRTGAQEEVEHEPGRERKRNNSRELNRKNISERIENVEIEWQNITNIKEFKAAIFKNAKEWQPFWEEMVAISAGANSALTGLLIDANESISGLGGFLVNEGLIDDILETYMFKKMCEKLELDPALVLQLRDGSKVDPTPGLLKEFRNEIGRQLDKVLKGLEDVKT